MRAWFGTYDCVANARIGKRKVAKCMSAEEIGLMEKGGVIGTLAGSISGCLVDRSVDSRLRKRSEKGELCRPYLHHTNCTIG
jgi:hypothetical protein